MTDVDKRMIWLRLSKEHQRRANVCAEKHREELAAGKYGPTTRVRLIPPGTERTSRD